jgi:arylsulfatase A-like enzyme
MLCLLAVIVLFPHAGHAASRPPNIVHFIADDLAYDDIRCFGATKIKTPNVDKLAAQAMRFTNFYAPSAICTPTRAAYMTGCYAQRVGLPVVLYPDDNKGLADSEITIAELLKSRGYATACIGKWHLGHNPEHLPTRHGFDAFFGIPYPNDMGPERITKDGKPRGYPPIPLFRDDRPIEVPAKLDTLTDRLVDESLKFIEQHKDRPFFLHLANIETHTPWFVPERFKGKSADGAYGDAVEAMDWMVGRIMETLDRLNLTEDTLLVFTSDNGPFYQPHRELEQIYGKYATVDPNRPHVLRAGKYHSRWEGGTRVPLIVRWPGKVKPNQTSEALSAGFDLYTTFAAAGGAAVPTDRIIDGRDLTPVLTGATDQSPHDAFYYYSGFQLTAVRQGDFKLLLPGQPPPDADQTLLFNVRTDPGETKNLAAEHPELVAQLQKVVQQARDDLGDARVKNPGKNRRAPGIAAAPSTHPPSAE